MMAVTYTNEQVRSMLEDWRKSNFNPNYKTIAKGVDLTYSYVVAWKNHDREMGQEALNKIVQFIIEN